MGGIGKTTIAGAIFNQISRGFEGKCFMANVKEESERGGLVRLQERVLSEILDKNIKIGTPNLSEGIKKRLQQMNVFIVLDDVNKLGQLDYLAGGLDRFGPGSKIIVTSRDKRFLDNFGVGKIYKVNGLENHEAFKHLRVLGSFLHQKNKLDLLICDPDIYDVLKVSYNELKA